jgi:hypothetical protein
MVSTVRGCRVRASHLYPLRSHNVTQKSLANASPATSWDRPPQVSFKYGKKKYRKKGTRTPLLGRMNPTDHLRLSPFAQPLLVAVAAA